MPSAGSSRDGGRDRIIASPPFCRARTYGVLERHGSDRRPASPRSSSRNFRHRLFSAARKRALHREAKKPAPAALHFIPALWVRADRPRSHDRHRGRDRRGPRNGDTTMATIGTSPRPRTATSPARSRPWPSTSKPSSSRPKAKASAAPTIGSSPAPPSSARPGRRPPAKPAANISRSSWTIRASRPRSTPAWSRTRAARPTTSSGPAAAQTEPGHLRSPAHLSGASSCLSAPSREYGNQDTRFSGFAALHVLIQLYARLPLTLTPGGLLGGLPPARRKGSLTLGRDGIPSLPPHRSSVPCRPGDPPPSRPPLLLAPPGLGDGQGCSAALRSNPSQ